jgi:hypothetical protein
MMNPAFDEIFIALRAVMAKHAGRLAVQMDTPAEYSLVTKSPSPFAQHKGRPMWFGAVKRGKAYVSYHLMPLYMSPALNAKIPAPLRKRMQGKTCFNFKTLPDAEAIAGLTGLTAAAIRGWQQYL